MVDEKTTTLKCKVTLQAKHRHDLSQHISWLSDYVKTWYQSDKITTFHFKCDHKSGWGGSGSSTQLTHCGLVMPYGDTGLNQHWFRVWFVAWKNQTEPMLTNHPKIFLKITFKSPSAQWVNSLWVPMFPAIKAFKFSSKFYATLFPSKGYHLFHPFLCLSATYTGPKDTHHCTYRCPSTYRCYAISRSSVDNKLTCVCC